MNVRAAGAATGCVALLAATVAATATYRWNRETARLTSGLTNEDEREVPAFALRALGDVPDAVRRYVKFALREGEPMHRNVLLHQSGEMRSSAEQRWAPFTAKQILSDRPLGFVWDASMRIAPGADVLVRDSYVQGSGVSQAALMALIPLGRIAGTPQVAQAALARFVAESAWLPTALLPAENRVWTAGGTDAAQLTVRDGATTTSIDFHFGPSGEISEVSTLRYRDVGGSLVLTPWSGSFSQYERIGGMMIPLAAEVAWTVAGRRTEVWRGRITDLRYDVPRPRAPLGGKRMSPRNI